MRVLPSTNESCQLSVTTIQDSDSQLMNTNFGVYTDVVFHLVYARQASASYTMICGLLSGKASLYPAFVSWTGESSCVAFRLDYESTETVENGIANDATEESPRSVVKNEMSVTF